MARFNVPAEAFYSVGRDVGGGQDRFMAVSSLHAADIDEKPTTKERRDALMRHRQLAKGRVALSHLAHYSSFAIPIKKFFRVNLDIQRRNVRFTPHSRQNSGWLLASGYDPDETFILAFLNDSLTDKAAIRKAPLFRRLIQDISRLHPMV